MTRLVVDASVVLDLLCRFRPDPIQVVLIDDSARLFAPALLDMDVLQVPHKLDAWRDPGLAPALGVRTLVP